MKTEALLAFKAFVEAKAKLHSINDYLKRNHDTEILELYPEIHVYDVNKFYGLAYELNVIVAEYPWESSSGNFDKKLSFEVTSKEYGITFEVYTLREAEKGASK